jgi:signal transduction histidine kinase
MNLFAISGLSVAISCVILSAITILVSKTTLHRLLLFFNLVVAVWGAGLYIVGIAHTESGALFGWRFAHAGGFFVGPVFYHLVSVLAERRRKKLLYFAYLQAMLFIPVGFATEFIFNKTRFVFGVYFIEMNPLYFIGFALYIFFVILSFYELFRYLPKTSGHKHTQALYIIIGFLIGFIGATSAFLPMFRIDIVYPLGNLGITLYVFILSYAILRYHLMDIRLVIRKSLVYSISAGILTALFIMLVLSISELFSGLVGKRSFLVLVGSALTIAFLFNPLKNKIQLFIDKVFYKATYDYYTVIQKVSHELAVSIDLHHIYGLIVDTINSTLKLKDTYLFAAENNYFETVYPVEFKGQTTESDVIHVRKIGSQSSLIELLKNDNKIYFKEELPLKVGIEKADIISQDLRPFNGEIIAPIYIDNTLTFFLICGEKRSGDIFSDEDIRLLDTIRNQGAIALKNAKLYSELEKKIEEKTEELKKSQAQLIQSEKLSAIGQMSAGLAHELNSPIAGLLLLVKQYRERAREDSEEYRHLTLMYNACEHMARVVKDFCAFSRRTQGEYADVNLIEVIESTLNLASSQFKQKNIQVIKKYAEKFPEIRGNRTELQQVILNIIKNSTDSMDENGILVIETAISNDGRNVTMKFTDNGSGISKEDLGRIFDPFYTTKAYGEGMGMGLSISYGIVNNHGGKISAESELSKGTKITVSLPAIGSGDGGKGNG